MKKYCAIFSVLMLCACATQSQAKKPCPPMSESERLMKTALGAYMVSQKYYVKMGCY